MSDLRFTKIAGAVLGCALGVMAVGTGAQALFTPHFDEQPGFAPDVDAAATQASSAPAQPEGPPDWGTVFGDPAALEALVARGERVHAVCTSCHTFEAGAGNRIGPELWDVFGRTAGTHGGFNYSDAMEAYAQPWSYDNLYEFLRSPSRYIQGTSMAFAGVRSGEDRQALVAYLHSLSNNPAPIPAPDPAAAAPAAEGPPA
jgi:cytochrome c